MEKISVIVCAYNEEKFIGKCLDSLLAQTYGGEIEIIVVDGQSEDRTVEIVAEYQSIHSNIVLLDNPRRLQSAGRNLGLEYSQTRLVAYLDAHSYADKTWLEQLYESLSKKLDENPNTAGVGSIHFDAGNSEFSAATTIAFNSLLGGKTITSYSAKTELQKVSWAYACLYVKNVLLKTGFYNPELVKGEDLELNLRITRKFGFDLYVSPQAVTYYYKKENLEDLYIQMYHYGYWRLVVMRLLGIHSFMNYSPALFITFLVGLLLISFVFPPLFLFWILIVIFYVLILFAFAVIESIKNKKNHLILFLIYLTIHFGYGFGILKGILKKKTL